MKPSLWNVLVLSLLVGGSWSQRPRDKAPPPRQHQQKQPASDDGDLTDECPEPNGYFADGYQCDKYYECKDGAITEKLCPDGMVFNDYSTLYEKCDLPFNIDCSQRSLMQDPKPSMHCPRQNGYFAHSDPKICDKFYFCVDGKFNMITCPSGLVYNEKTGICTWPDEAKKKHCSSQAEESNRIKRVAFWKSDEETSASDSKGMSDEDPGSYYDSASVEKGRKRDTGSADYGSAESAEYPDYGAGSGSGEPDYEGASYPNYDNAYDDPEFSNFDAEFQEFANAGTSGLGYPGFTPHDFIRRKKDSDDDLDGYIKGYVKTIGKDPKVFNFECPKVDEKRAQQHPRYPDPEDCQFFYVCINGEVPRRNGCKIGQVFNEATGSCDWPRNVPECKEWYKGVLTDEELEALEHPKPKVRNSNYTSAAQKRKRPHQSAQYDLPN